MRRALRDERLDLGEPRVIDRLGGVLVERVQRQVQRPQHEPGGLVEGVRGAMPKRNARLTEAGGLGLDQFQQRHSSKFSSARR